MLTKEESKTIENKPKQVELTIYDDEQQLQHNHHVYNSIDQHSEDSLSDVDKLNELKLITQTIMKTKSNNDMKMINTESTQNSQITDSSDGETDDNELKGLMQKTILKLRHDDALGHSVATIHAKKSTSTPTKPFYTNDSVHFKIDRGRNIEDDLLEEDTDGDRYHCCRWIKTYAKSIIFMILTTVYIILSASISGDNADIWILRIEFILVNITILTSSILIYKFVSYSLLVCTTDNSKCHRCCRATAINKILFYTKYSEKYLSYTLFCLFVYILFFVTIDTIHSRYHELFDVAVIINPQMLDRFKDILICLIILFLCLFFKIVLIRHLLVTYYILSPHDQKMKDMKKYEIWLKIVLNVDKIFSIEVDDFININSIHQTNNTKYQKQFGIPCHSLALSLSVYQQFVQEMQLIQETKRKDVNVNKFVLWYYDPNTNNTSIINDNKLHKLCQEFAKYIIENVNTNKVMKPKAKLGGLNLYTASVDLNQQKLLLKDKICNQHKKEELHVTEEDFKTCFKNNKNAICAWKCMNIDDDKDEKLTLTELQRWLRRYFHDLIYMKQTLNSYEDILANLDVSTNVIVIFFLLFVFLLIFNNSFEKTITMYAALIAVAAIFGGSLLKEFIESVYFIFSLNPFSIGDVILVDNVRYTVKHVNIMSTELITSFTNSHYVVIKRNSNLLRSDITNVTKSKTPYHNISFYVSQTTSMTKINDLRRKIRTFMETEMGTDINDFWFVLNGVDKECRMKITLHIGSNYAFSDAQIMWKQYHKINMHIRHMINKMGIHYKRFSLQDTQQSALYD